MGTDAPKRVSQWTKKHGPNPKGKGAWRDPQPSTPGAFRPPVTPRQMELDVGKKPRKTGTAEAKKAAASAYRDSAERYEVRRERVQAARMKAKQMDLFPETLKAASKASKVLGAAGLVGQAAEAYDMTLGARAKALAKRKKDLEA